MQPARRAVIDVGTNSVKLLVADVERQEVRPVLEESDQTRLGRGFYETHCLQAEAIAGTAEAVARFHLAPGLRLSPIGNGHWQVRRDSVCWFAVSPTRSIT